MAEIQTYPDGTPIAGDKVPYVADPDGTPALMNADASVFLGGGGGGGGLSWTQTIDEDGTSTAHFTSLGGGTWTVDSGAIKVVGAGTPSNLFYSADTMSVMNCVVEADVMLLSSNGGDCYAGVGVLQSTGNDAPWHGYGPFVRIQRTGGVFRVLAGRVSTDQTSEILAGGAMDTWFTVRMVMNGGAADSYINGDLATATRGTAEYRADTLTLWSYAADAKWRNIKAWVADMGLPA
jgi:hypothetical protein